MKKLLAMVVLFVGAMVLFGGCSWSQQTVATFGAYTMSAGVFAALALAWMLRPTK